MWLAARASPRRSPEASQLVEHGSLLHAFVYLDPEALQPVLQAAILLDSQLRQVHPGELLFQGIHFGRPPGSARLGIPHAVPRGVPVLPEDRQLVLRQLREVADRVFVLQVELEDPKVLDGSVVLFFGQTSMLGIWMWSKRKRTS